jgi:hypothetical protein
MGISLDDINKTVGGIGDLITSAVEKWNSLQVPASTAEAQTANQPAVPQPTAANAVTETTGLKLDTTTLVLGGVILILLLARHRR